MSFLNAHVVVSPNNVHLGIIAAFDKCINHVIDTGKRRLVFDSVTVDLSVVLD